MGRIEKLTVSHVFLAIIQIYYFICALHENTDDCGWGSVAEESWYIRYQVSCCNIIRVKYIHIQFNILNIFICSQNSLKMGFYIKVYVTNEGISPLKYWSERLAEATWPCPCLTVALSDCVSPYSTRRSNLIQIIINCNRLNIIDLIVMPLLSFIS